MKTYLKPEVEIVEFKMEAVTTSDIMGGEAGGGSGNNDDND